MARTAPSRAPAARTLLSCLVLAVLLVPTMVHATDAEAEPDHAASWQAVKDSLSAGDVATALATYDDAFGASVSARNASLDDRIHAAFDDAAAHGPGTLNYTLATQTIDKGILNGGYLSLHHALFEAEDAHDAEAWFGLLHAKFGDRLDDAYLRIEQMEQDATAIPAERDEVDEAVLAIFESKVREEIEEVFLFWDNATASDGFKRQEKAVEALAYYGPLRADVAASLGAEAEEELHHELEELLEYAVEGDRESAEHAGDEALALLVQYGGGDGGADADVASFLSALDLLVIEYDEYVQDGQVVDSDGYEGEIKALFLPAVKERWTAIEPTVAAVDAAEAEEIAGLVAELETKVLNLAPNADVAALADHIAIEVQEVTGAQETVPEGEFAQGMADLRGTIQAAVDAYADGDVDTALSLLQSAYLDVYAPRLESKILANAPRLNAQIEDLMNIQLRSAMQSGASVAEVQSIADELDAKLTAAEEAVVQTRSPLKLFLDSLLIIVREGFEAILVVGAVATYLIRSGNRDKLKDLWIGVGAALVATGFLYVLVQTVFELSGANREILEGVTALLAAAVLFYVSYWLISKVQVGKWNRFIHGKVRGALASGKTWALAGVAFLAVFREGLETVLFYQGLYATSGDGGAGAVTLGFLVGCVVLVGIFVAFYKYGVKIKLRPFFIVTSILLYYLAFTFLGAGIHELQEAGVAGTTVIGPLADLFHDVPWLAATAGLFGIYPTWETLLAQAGLLVVGLGGVVYTFQIEPRLTARRRAAASPADAEE